MELHEYTEQQLQAELKRRKDAYKPEPAFKCLKCGKVGYFHAWIALCHESYNLSVLDGEIVLTNGTATKICV